MKRSERHERDRQRLRRVLGLAKYWRSDSRWWTLRLADAAKCLADWNGWYHNAARWSTAWKAAAKEWKASCLGWEYTAMFVLDVLNAAYQREDKLEADLAKRTEVRDDLRVELMDLASANLEILAERDALAERLEALTEDPLAVCEKCDAGKRLEEARVIMQQDDHPREILRQLADALRGEGEG